MSDDESEGEVPVCGSFEPQVWRKGYCRNCFHPGNKHLSENILKLDDNKKLGKENIPKKTDKSSKDAPPADKTKPFKRTGQDSLKSAADKGSGLKTDKLLDKDKPLSAKDKYAKLQQDKAQSKDSSSPPKTGVEKFKDGKKIIPDKKDSTNTIPPPVLPKTKGKGLAADDKFKSKSTSDIREAIKSPVGNKLFKPPGQNDALDKPKSKFGSAENISLSAKKLDESSKSKSGSAENISSDKSKQPQKVNKDSEKKESPTNDASKPDYRSLLSNKDSKSDSGKTTSDKYVSISKKDNKLKDKPPTQQPESKFKLGKDSKLLTKEKAEVAKLDDPTGDASKKGFPFKQGLKSKTENTDLKSPLNEKDKPDYKAKFEKPELKSSSKTEEKDKKDFKAKYEKPELKALKLGDKHKEDENSKTKSIDIEKKSDNNLKFKKDDSASRKTEEADKSTLGKLKLKPSANSESKDKQSPASLKDDRSPKDEKYKLVDLKAGLKTAAKTDDKDKIKINTPDKDIKPKFEKPELKSAKSDDKGLSVLAKTLEKDKNKPLEYKEKSKTIFGNLEKDKSKDLKTDDSKQKYEKPALKSVKDDEKGKVSSKKEDDSKSGKTDLKSVLNKDNKFDFKTLVDNKKSKSLNNSEVETVDEKAKLSRPGLKSSKVDDTSKKDFKAKFERPQLKPTKSDEPKSDDKSAQIKDDFSSHKREENVPLNKPSDPSKDKETKSKDVPKIYNDIKKASKTECQDDKSPIKPKEREPLSTSTTTRLDETAALKQETQVNGENLLSDTEAINSFSSDSNPQHLVNLSSDAETDLDEPDNACAVISAHNDSPVHVDTQVFTSSRRKTAGVDSENSDLFTTTPQKGFSGSQVLKSVSPSREKSEEKESIKNGHISEDVKEKSNENTEQKTVAIVDIGDDIEKLKLELSKMAEKCQELEGENDSLRHGLSAKESDHSDLEKQKHEVESLILDLKDQLKSMEDRCVKLESDNSNLMTSLKEQEEVTEHQASTEDADNIHDDIKESEDVCETLMEENEDLKQEILDLKVEMEEMYDSFRDQEAEEFRELQKELEITAKNCRILQFKMRKAERRNEQLEDDRNLFQDKLRILQNQFENKDAVSHIKTLEEELKMAKDVSVRLHDELDLMDDKRTKVEEENRHLTELLEQADRKQFRLEIEVDKLRDQIIDLRQQLKASSAGDDPSSSQRKVTLAATERQNSQEIDVQQIKRELYDSKEREADLRDQMKFMEGDERKMRKKIRDLEDENDNMSKHLRKMTIQHALLSKLQSENGSKDNGKAEAEVEKKVQYEMLEEELSVLKRKITEMEEENEMLHKEMFVLEKRIKEKDHQLQLPVEPSSPNSFYQDKIKEYEKEADEFRWKLVEKEKEIEQLYGQLTIVEKRKGKGLRKTRSLDSTSGDVDSDYSHVVEIKRQLEFSQQESNVLRDRVIALETENNNLVSDLESLKEQSKEQVTSPLTALAVAYVETENEDQLKAQIKEMDSLRETIIDRIASVAENCTLLVKTHYPSFLEESLPATADAQYTGKDETRSRDSLLNFCRLKTLTMATPGNGLMLSGNMAESQEITGVTSRDPEKLLSVIDESFSVLVQRIKEMDTAEEQVVRTDGDSLEGGNPPDMSASSVLESEGDDSKMPSGTVSAARDHLMDKILDLEEETGLEPVMCKTTDPRPCTSTVMICLAICEEMFSSHGSLLTIASSWRNTPSTQLRDPYKFITCCMLCHCYTCTEDRIECGQAFSIFSTHSKCNLNCIGQFCGIELCRTFPIDKK